MCAMARDITSVWSLVEDLAGETFHQKRGAAFTYDVSGHTLIPNRINRVLARSELEKALAQVPPAGPGEIQHLQGPS